MIVIFSKVFSLISFMGIKKVNIVPDMIGEVLCYNLLHMTPKSVKTRSNETIQVSSVSSNPTHTQNQTRGRSVGCLHLSFAIQFCIFIILSITQHIPFEMCGSHSSEYQDCKLLECCTV
jgi:hypothetical protein